jgi:uncharacterized phosphosugar-binding protein
MHRDPGTFGAFARDHLERIEQANAATIAAVAERVAATIEADGVLYPAGTGHSLALVLETFYRAGGLANVRPVHHPALLPLHGGPASTLLERVEGFAALLLKDLPIGPADTAIVVSNSGVNPVPVELARGFKERGAPVVAIVSLPHHAEAPRRSSSTLVDEATWVLDTGSPVGDASLEVGTTRVAPLSNLAGIHLWNLVLAATVALLDARGVVPPVWQSSNASGGDERNAELRRRFEGRIPT